MMTNVLLQVLLHYAQSTDPSFGNELVSSILSTCSRSRYELVSDFTWYVSVLADIARIPHCEHGEEVGRQLVDIALRVESVRTDVVKVSRGLLVDPALLGRPALQGVLCAAAWIVGEYVELAPFGPYEILEALLQPRTRLLPFSIHAVYLQGVLKVFVSFASTCQNHFFPDAKGNGGEGNAVQPGQNGGGSLQVVVRLIKENVAPLVKSVDMEVQERACNVLGLLELFEDPGKVDKLHEGFETSAALCNVFSIELGPVSVHAQSRVGVPEGLSIEENLDALGPVGGSDEVLLHTDESRPSSTHREWEAEFGFQPPGKEDLSVVDSSAALLAQHRHRHENYYLGSDAGVLDYPAPQVASEPAALLVSTEASKPNESSSLQWTKPRQTKARRPVVVTLDDEEDPPGVLAPVSKKGLKDEFMATAIRDALSTDGHKARVADGVADGAETSLRVSSSRRSRSHRPAKGKEKSSSAVADKVGVANTDGDRQISDSGGKEHSRSKHRPSKHEILVIKDGSSSENDNEGTFKLSEKVQKKKHKHGSSHRHSRHPARSPVSTNHNTNPIPDFLL